MATRPSGSSVAGRGRDCRNYCVVPPGLNFVPLCYPALTCRAFLCRRFAAGGLARSIFLRLRDCDRLEGAQLSLGKLGP
jgi:hypothetical protein